MFHTKDMEIEQLRAQINSLQCQNARSLEAIVDLEKRLNYWMNSYLSTFETPIVRHKLRFPLNQQRSMVDLRTIHPSPAPELGIYQSTDSSDSNFSQSSNTESNTNMHSASSELEFERPYTPNSEHIDNCQLNIEEIRPHRRTSWLNRISSSFTRKRKPGKLQNAISTPNLRHSTSPLSLSMKEFLTPPESPVDANNKKGFF